jgi:hypothetical protein
MGEVEGRINEATTVRSAAASVSEHLDRQL